MNQRMSLGKEYVKGLWEINPIFKQMLGMCPTLAVTVSAINGIAMGLAVTFVLFFSSLIISFIRKLIPSQVRIAVYIVIIATFVTIVDLVMKAQFADLSRAMGPFIPLIVVNCLILGRQEAFASKNNPGRAVLDALGNGSGFLLALFALGSVRELFGSRTILGFAVLPETFQPWLIMILPPGAFVTLGLMIAAANEYVARQRRRQRETVLAGYKRADARSPLERAGV